MLIKWLYLRYLQICSYDHNLESRGLSSLSWTYAKIECTRRTACLDSQNPYVVHVVLWPHTMASRAYANWLTVQRWFAKPSIRAIPFPSSYANYCATEVEADLVHGICIGFVYKVLTQDFALIISIHVVCLSPRVLRNESDVMLPSNPYTELFKFSVFTRNSNPLRLGMLYPGTDLNILSLLKYQIYTIPDKK